MTNVAQITPSRYTLHHTLADLGFDPLRIATAVEVLLGPEPEAEPEPYEPSDEDLADYASWSDRLDRDGFTFEVDNHDYVSDRDIVAVLGCAG
jgi:hypothetical protein